MRQNIARLLPGKLTAPARRLYQYLEYGIGQRIGRRDPLIPPESLHSVSGKPLDVKDFRKVGKEFFRYFVNLGGIQPHQKVLDVGSGTGRMALPLTRYLKNGSYEGMDIVAPSIEWCQKTYTPRYPNFHFHFGDIYNKMYNPAGKYKASEYRFPFGTSSFDFVFLTSVFTHMLPEDLDNYLSEVVRVLKPEGRCLITYFLLNPESLGLIEAKLSRPQFKYALPGCRVGRTNVPEAVVAYDESTIRGLYQKYGLKLLEPIYFGKWCERKNGLSYQDMIVATKPR
jgi:ubiquinone/menaquinone biosynthesis C-methylase UbiE